MSARICRSMDDVRDFYYYKKYEPPVPKKFPCVMAEEDNDGGLMGQHYSYEFIYAPDHYFGDAAEAYLAGVLSVKRF